MNIQTVTILVQSVIILFALVALGFCAWTVTSFKTLADSERKIAARAIEELGRVESLAKDYLKENDRLRQQVQQIPLQEKPKRVDNSVKQARTSGDVRRLTEQAWGTAMEKLNDPRNN